MVRELTKAEQARGALVGTPGSTHARHSEKPAKEYGAGFFGGKGFARAFVLGTLLTLAAFIGFVAWNEARLAEMHGEEPTVEEELDQGTLDTSGTA